MTERDPRWIDSQHDIDNKAEEQRQIEKVWADSRERRARAQRAMDALFDIRQQLLALELRLGRNVTWEEQAGNWELANVYRRCQAAVKQARNGKLMQDLVTDDPSFLSDYKGGKP